jgi:hypothetical protein
MRLTPATRGVMKNLAAHPLVFTGERGQADRNG